MSTSKSSVRFGSCGDGLYLAIDGEATRRACPALDRLVSDYLAVNQESAKIVLDLGSALWVDSTFAGWILRVLRKVGGLSGGSLNLSACSEECFKSLDTMQLTSLIGRSASPVPEKMTTVACQDCDVSDRAMLELIAEAHEELASLDEENRLVFGPIAAKLREELQ